MREASQSKRRFRGHRERVRLRARVRASQKRAQRVNAGSESKKKMVFSGVQREGAPGSAFGRSKKSCPAPQGWKLGDHANRSVAYVRSGGRKARNRWWDTVAARSTAGKGQTARIVRPNGGGGAPEDAAVGGGTQSTGQSTSGKKKERGAHRMAQSGHGHAGEPAGSLGLQERPGQGRRD